MTKKHFVMMAAKFKGLYDSAADVPECRAGIILAVYAFCDVAEDANGRFDRDRFCKAAGIHG